MIVHQKTKGKRELLNFKSSINYGDANASSRRWKGKAHMTYDCVPLWVLWVVFQVVRFISPCFSWVPLWVVFGCSFSGSRVLVL